MPHLATGDMLRRHVAEGTEIGRAAEDFMTQGELVPDRLVLELVGDRIAGAEPLAGYVLDGFPRTLEQAKAAYEWGKANDRTFHAVISLVVPEEELIRRVPSAAAGRGGPMTPRRPCAIAKPSMRRAPHPSSTSIASAASSSKSTGPAPSTRSQPASAKQCREPHRAIESSY